jgi:eukaryotic-like serine/threonine-protein kinase
MIDRVLNDRYRVSSLLGEGGMALVYEAEDLLLGRRVAVKILREQYASDRSFLARFQREARAAASLSHPNIVAVYDVGSDAGTQYIVMELVTGRTLKEMIDEQAPLAAARIVDLGRQICDALEYAHQYGIVHRDVKPHNILVTRDGRAKIADFGIAVALGGSSLTEPGYVVGSAQYVSPEQASGEPATSCSDVYSTGIVLYEMATGRLPFDGDSSVVVALKHLQEPPVPPRRLNPRIPESLQRVILTAMAKDPDDRFSSGAEMGEALMSTARAGFEATHPQPAVARRPARPEPAEPAAQASSQREGRSSGWMVMVVVFAAFLCTLSSIPLGILAYSNGMLDGIFPGRVVAQVSTATPTPGPTATATPSPTPTATPTATPTPVVVPGLVGVLFSTARQQAQALGLDVAIAGEAYSSEYPAAHIISQKPSPGSLAETGAPIEVVLSMGKDTAPVPRVVGDSISVARQRLQDAGFLIVAVTEETSERVPAGVVISQKPAPEVTTDKGSRIDLAVSSGREKVSVPDVVGLSEAEAQDTIVEAGLSRTWVNYQDFTFVPPGHVLSQDPKPDTMVEKGTTVYIAVRKPEPTQAPSSPGNSGRRKDG